MTLEELGFHKSAGMFGNLRRMAGNLSEHNPISLLNRRNGMANSAGNMGRRATDFAADGRKMVPRTPDRRGTGLGSNSGDRMGDGLIKKDPSLNSATRSGYTGRRYSDQSVR